MASGSKCLAGILWHSILLVLRSTLILSGNAEHSHSSSAVWYIFFPLSTMTECVFPIGPSKSAPQLFPATGVGEHHTLKRAHCQVVCITLHLATGAATKEAAQEPLSFSQCLSFPEVILSGAWPHCASLMVQVLGDHQSYSSLVRLRSHGLGTELGMCSTPWISPQLQILQ